MTWLWYGVEIAVNLVETGLFLYLINSKFYNKTNSCVPALMTLFIGAAGLSCVGLFQCKEFPDYLILPTVFMIYTLLSRSGEIWLKMFWVFIGFAMLSASAVIGIALCMLLPGVTMDAIMSQTSAVRLQVLISCKLLQAVLFFMLSAKKGIKRTINLPTTITLILVPVTSIFTVALLIEYGLGPATSFTHHLLLVGASMSILFINLIVFLLYESLTLQAENNLQMQAKIQQSDMIMHHNEEISGLYEELRGWRHDYHNHLQIIYGYLQLEKFDKLESYLKGIEQSITSLEMPVNSGNPLIDAIVGSKILLAGKHSVRFDTDIHVPPDLSMNDIDMCVLLGNLLDNAIEACQRIEQGERFIEMSIRAIKGHLHIMVRNSTNGVIEMSGTRFVSGKIGKHHGIGIKRIDEITEKYNGYANRSHVDAVFETNIMLPLTSLN